MEGVNQNNTRQPDRDPLGLLCHPNPASLLRNLGETFFILYEQSGIVKDLDFSILFYRDAFGLYSPGPPNRPNSLSKFAHALSTRYELSGRLEDLDDAILLNREALDLFPPADETRHTSSIDLADCLLDRYRRSGGMNDLEEAILYCRDALNHRLPDRTNALLILAISLVTRYEQSGRMKDLEENISILHEALKLSPRGSLLHPHCLMNLSVALYKRYEAGFDTKVEDINNIIASQYDALKLLPSGDPNRPIFLTNIASSLLARYGHLGKIEDLENCISSYHESVILRPPGHPDRATSLMNLGSAVSTRFWDFARTEDLNDAISFYRESLELRPHGHPRRSSSLINLASSLLDLYRELHNGKDLQDGIILYQEGFGLLSENHPHYPTAMMNLAYALLDFSRLVSQVEPLNSAISLFRQSLRLRPPGDPERSKSLRGLAGALEARYVHSHTLEDLEEALSLYHELMILHPLGHPLRASSLALVANAYMQFNTPEGCHEAFLLYDEATKDITSVAKHRFSAAVQWAGHARSHQDKSALRAYSRSLPLLNRCLISCPNVESQQKFLATAGIAPRSLASNAAASALDAGKVELAVELLEQGRAILWSRVDAYKYPLEQLRQVEGGGELADRLEMLGAELERRVLLSSSLRLDEKPSHRTLASSDERLKQYRILSEEWEKVVGRIRKIRGFTNFLQAPPFSTLQSAAVEGPVILINASDYRSDAIILHNQDSPTVISLPTIQPVDLIDKAKKLASGRESVNVLRYLWVNIVSPVVDSLTRLKIRKKSRIWWCPTAELYALPLHAAGPYCPDERNLPDIFTSSYISTLSSLIKARSNVIQPPKMPRLLVVGQSGETLERVNDEVDIIRQLGSFVDVLTEADANPEAVLEGLKQHSWVHLACHGHLGDNAQPFQASFELHNGRRLTLLELIRARVPNAELAFLSACHTAAGDSRTPDENIHLSAALQFCGFRSVVGTLWEMDDDDGPTIAKEFYRYMFRDPGRIDFRDSAQALNSAIRVMRKARLPFERWIMFVHIGA